MRGTYKNSLLPALAGLLLLSTGCKNEPITRPNILFAIADDWGWPHAGVYGDPVVKTPAFDRIATEGILFHHAYISSPSCTPSRNAILTGQQHWRLGPGANLWSTLDPSTPVYPLLLEDAGYRIGHYRKSWGPSNLSDWDRHPAGPNYDEGGFERFLDEWDGKQPFCFWLGSYDPHRPYDRGSGAAAGISPDSIRLFGCFPDHETVRSDVADYYYEVQRFDSLVAGALELLEARGQLENTLVVATGDHGMPFPRCKANNYDSGARVPLAVRWGDGIRAPGRVIEDFISTTDLAPTFLKLAGVEVPAVMTGSDFLDLLQTGKDGFVDKGHRSFVIHGKERHVPGQEDHTGGYPVRAIRTHDYLYIRNLEPDWWPAGTPDYKEAIIPWCWLGDCDNGPTKTYMVENRNLDESHAGMYRLAFGKRPPEELYDCRTDPDQLVNLAADPAYAEKLAELSGKLDEQLLLTEDPRMEGIPGFDFAAVPYLGSGPRHPSYQPESE